MRSKRAPLPGPSIEPTPRPLRNVAICAVSTIVVSAVVWATVTVFSDSSSPAEAPRYGLASAHRGVVHQKLPIHAAVTWPSVLVARNEAIGTVTSLDLGSTSMSSAGDTLFSVGLRPVIAAEGDVPMFRSLKRGVSGPDVRQLQKLMDDLGYRSGFDDGVFGKPTESSVKAWQQHAGVAPTGVVLLGDVVFVGRLPAHLSLDAESIMVGAHVSGGEPAIEATAAVPNIEASLGSADFGRVTEGMAVRLDTSQGRWDGEIGRLTPDGNGTVTAAIVRAKGRPCGSACIVTASPGKAETLSGELSLVPRTEGVIVPTVALHSSGRSAFVLDSDGHRRAVRIEVSADGESIVTGLPSGTPVRVPSAAG